MQSSQLASSTTSSMATASSERTAGTCISAVHAASSAPASLRASPKRAAKCKGWAEESMHAVIKAVEEGITTSQAARDNGVPKTLTRTKALH